MGQGFIEPVNLEIEAQVSTQLFLSMLSPKLHGACEGRALQGDDPLYHAVVMIPTDPDHCHYSCTL